MTVLLDEITQSSESGSSSSQRWRDFCCVLGRQSEHYFSHMSGGVCNRYFRLITRASHTSTGQINNQLFCVKAKQQWHFKLKSKPIEPNWCIDQLLIAGGYFFTLWHVLTDPHYFKLDTCFYRQMFLPPLTKRLHRCSSSLLQLLSWWFKKKWHLCQVFKTGTN